MEWKAEDPTEMVARKILSSFLFADAAGMVLAYLDWKRKSWLGDTAVVLSESLAIHTIVTEYAQRLADWPEGLVLLDILKHYAHIGLQRVGIRRDDRRTNGTLESTYIVFVCHQNGMGLVADHWVAKVKSDLMHMSRHGIVCGKVTYSPTVVRMSHKLWMTNEVLQQPPWIGQHIHAWVQDLHLILQSCFARRHPNKTVWFSVSSKLISHWNQDDFARKRLIFNARTSPCFTKHQHLRKPPCSMNTVIRVKFDNNHPIIELVV